MERCRNAARHHCDCYACLRDELVETRRCGCGDCYYRYRELEHRMRYVEYREVHTPRMYGKSSSMQIFYDEYKNVTPEMEEYMKKYLSMDFAQGIDQTVIKQLTSGEKNMNLVDKVKNLKLSAADKLLRKHDVVDAEGDLTETGQELIWAKLLDAYKVDLVADLKAVDAAEKGKCK